MKEHFHQLGYYIDHPATGVTLVAAGFLPNVVDLQWLQALYFLVIIPPAAFHCYSWFKVSVQKPVLKWWDKWRNK